ncbi:unnamed protein product, partial [Staurois parvus]
YAILPKVLGQYHCIQVFQSPPWPQVYKIKHLGMQTASINICERMGHSQELRECKHGTMIGCHLCSNPIREISLLLKCSMVNF